MYLQKMSSLESTQACVYAKFKSGYHVIRGGDTYLAGLDFVLTIEQPITKWELTRGNIVTTGHIDIGNYRVSAIQLAMQSLITRQYTTIAQHKSLKLLFTETRLTSIYCARNSTVSSHAQLPRNAQTTYVNERSPNMISQNVLHYLSRRLERRLPLLD